MEEKADLSRQLPAIVGVGGTELVRLGKSGGLAARGYEDLRQGALEDLLQKAHEAYRKREYEEALALFQTVAETGNAEAQFKLGSMYHDAKGVSENVFETTDLDQEAIRWYRLAAEKGHADAQYKLGEMYFKGRGVTTDDEEAERWTRLAAEQGHVDAQFSLGKRYDSSSLIDMDLDAGWNDSELEKLNRENIEAVLWYRRAATQGHAAAQCHLGQMYDLGHGVPESIEQAIHWYRLAVEQGDAGARFNLGGMYESGRGVAQSNEEAFRLYSQVAEVNELAQQAIFRLYGNRHGAQQGSDEEGWYLKGITAFGAGKKGVAAEFFRLAAERGHAKAQFLAAHLYEIKIGPRKRDLEVAAKFCRIAADQGEPCAQFKLGYFYECGLGVRSNKRVAAKWYKEAANNGIGTAAYQLTNLIQPYSKFEFEQSAIHDEKMKWLILAAKLGNSTAAYLINEKSPSFVHMTPSVLHTRSLYPFCMRYLGV